MLRLGSPPRIRCSPLRAGVRRSPTRLLPLFPLLLIACTDRDVSGPEMPDAAIATDEANSPAEMVRELAAGRGIGPLPRPAPVRPALVELGRALAFDPILSGNKDISCMTCHVPSLGTGDARHLAIGQGASGLGAARVHPDGLFIPRNAPPLFNLHALDKLFWDGRVSVDESGRFHTPAGKKLTPNMTRVFEFGAVSALGLFPVVSPEEMRGFGGNELAEIPDDQLQRIWGGLMRRLGGIEEYRQMFEAAYPGTPFPSMTFAHASNAIGGFLVSELAFDDSPWDRFLAGEDDALTPEQLEGARIFMEIRCSICHNGPAFSDGDFHNVALAQVGPGQGDGLLGNDDFGHERVSRDARHRYAFRTTPLRNVELSGPYGHAGQFTDLSEFIDHYSESHEKLLNYDVSLLEPQLQGTLVDNFDGILATRDTIIEGVVLPPEIVESLTEYMHALTDPAARDLEHLIPERVPSGLPVER